MYGDGSQKRDFTYVDDMVEAFLYMGSHPDAVGRAVNFGSGTAISIAELASLVVAAANSGSTIVTGAARAAEVACLCCDPSLAERLFGWYARVNLVEGLRSHVRWARDRL